MDLIPPSRAAQSPALSALAGSNPGYLASLITAASDSIRKTCGRDFTLTTYSEYYSGGIYIREPLRLRQFPVVEITRVAASPRPALLVQNTDSVTNQRATIETTLTGLRLVRIASAIPTTIDLPFTTYPTIATMVAAIIAQTNGWSATIRNDFTNWPSADLKPLQGAATTLNGGRDLEIYTEDLQPFTAWPYSATIGEGACDDGCQGTTGWRLDDQTGELFGRFPRGQLNIRIDYQAGFPAVPQPVQEACVQLVQDLYQAALVNHSLKKAKLGPGSIELNAQAGTAAMSPKVRMLLAGYMDYSKVIFR